MMEKTKYSKVVLKDGSGVEAYGNEGILNEKHFIAVVGSRKMSLYGKKVVKDLVGELAAAGVVIVSGFMYGVDLEAHKTALSAGGRTIAVLGYGLNFMKKVPYIQQTIKTINESGRGLIISQYKADFTPTKWSFSKRNNLIAGISDAVLVVEAGIESGSLITAGYALDQNKDVYSVPSNIYSTTGKGANYLIKQGAILIDNADELLEYIGLESGRIKKNRLKNIKRTLSEEERKVLKIIEKAGVVLFDEIKERMDIEPALLLSILTILEASKVIETEIDGSFRIS